jgi:hypothetical protein
MSDLEASGMAARFRPIVHEQNRVILRESRPLESEHALQATPVGTRHAHNLGTWVDRPWLPDGNEPDTEGKCDARSEDKSTGLDRGHFRDSLTLERFGESLDSSGKELSVGEKTTHVRVAVDPAKARQEVVLERHGPDSAGSASPRLGRRRAAATQRRPVCLGDHGCPAGKDRRSLSSHGLEACAGHGQREEAEDEESEEKPRHVAH